ncbi:hypothetical protein HAHE_39730 [Haloferula helveola]|uniref:Uncharacterized protein n=1 Tax=Haloferula helveola TaxID=490095 RepID=A0ABM7RHX2_9BACT|nr:hypothetical protein HAHE_39730 [Haloferula helveola]
MPTCSSCGAPLAFVGVRSFETNGQAIDDLASGLRAEFAPRHHLRLFVCPGCGTAQLRLHDSDFARLQERRAAHEIVARLREEYQSVQKHPKWREFLASDPANRYLEGFDQEATFAAWLAERPYSVE